MAILNDTKFEGVDLPYEKVCSFSGSKDRMKITIGNAKSQEFNCLKFREVELSKEFSDKITSMIYQELKNNDLIIGQDC